MTRNFFLVLLVVIVFELLARFLMALYEFNTQQKADTALTAEHLVGDVIAIMRNSGGSVAARTFNPILKRNHKDIGYEIAMEPSLNSINSMEVLFDYTPSGIPGDWPEGRYNETRLDIRADSMCLSCHTNSRLGDVLGTIIVRNYFFHHLNRWLEEVRITSLFGLGKILFHTIILFFLLKVRMESLLSLRFVVANLSKPGADLSHRAT